VQFKSKIGGLNEIGRREEADDGKEHKEQDVNAKDSEGEELEVGEV